jgi:serine/threonine-protein kinase CTR1
MESVCSSSQEEIATTKTGPLGPTCSSSDIHVLGSGSFCMVLKAKYGNKKVALKCLKQQGELDSEQHLIAIEDLREEARIIESLNHPNIVSFHALGYNFEGSFFFVMERLQKHTLDTRLREWRKKTKKKLRFWQSTSPKGVPSLFERLSVIGLNLGQALDYLHQKQIVHCDIKPDNVGFDQDGEVQLFDFGLSRDLSRKAPAEDFMSGTYRYMAPEVMQAQPVSVGADVYSFSLLLWELATLEQPHSDIKDIEGLANLVINKGGRPSLERIKLEKLREVLQACWKPNPLERASSDNVVEGMIDVISELKRKVDNDRK